MTASLWGKHIAGPILALIAICFGIAAAVAPNASRLVVYSAWATGIATVLLMFRAQYDAWRETDTNLAEEKQKNEAEPHIDIRCHNIVSRNSTSSGVTDLFFFVELVLGEPRSVTIDNFSLNIFDQAHSSTNVSVDDVRDWIWKGSEAGQSKIVGCIPVGNALTRRGEPVFGWIHFAIPNTPEQILMRSQIRFNVNGKYGTCYIGIDAALIRADDFTGRMERKTVHEGT